MNDDTNYDVDLNIDRILDAYRYDYEGPAEWLCASSPKDMAIEWAAKGFGYDAADWWRAGCYDPDAAAELRDVNVADDPDRHHVSICPEHLATVRVEYDGLMVQIGHLHADCVISTQKVIDLYRESLR